MRKTTRRVGLTLAATAGLACAVPAAFAAGTFTVTAGSAAAGTVVPFHASTTGTTPQIHFNDTTSNVGFTCDSGTAGNATTAGGQTTVGTGLSGTPIATISGPATTWTNCQGAGFNFTVAGSGTWNLNATSGSSAGAAGNISNVTAAVTGTGAFGTTCNFTVTGSTPANYTNADTTLHVTAGTGLKISGASGTCVSLGVITNGDAATFVGDYLVGAQNSANDPIHITQP